MELNSLTFLSNAARIALPGLRDLVLGSPDDRAEWKAIRMAAWMAARDVLKRGGEDPDHERVTFVATSLTEALHRAGSVSLQTVSDTPTRLRATILRGLEQAFAPLDEQGSGLREMGIDVPANEVARTFLDQLTENLLLWGGRGALVRDIALQLQIEKLRDDLAAATLEISTEGEQARMVHAWITVETDPPQVEVYNDSAAPITSVVPTPALIGANLEGEVVAMVGGGTLWNARVGQVSPGHGYVWNLPHMASWQGGPLVFSQLHIDFTDAAGRRWRSAHDRVSRIDGPDAQG